MHRVIREHAYQFRFTVLVRTTSFKTVFPFPCILLFTGGYEVGSALSLSKLSGHEEPHNGTNIPGSAVSDSRSKTHFCPITSSECRLVAL